MPPALHHTLATSPQTLRPGRLSNHLLQSPAVAVDHRFDNHSHTHIPACSNVASAFSLVSVAADHFVRFR